MENRSNNLIPLCQTAPERSFWTFRYPHEVLRDPNMSADEKRAVLAAWASDEHAVESFPTLRHLPGTPLPVTFSSIMEARLQLDRMCEQDDDPPPWRPLRQRRFQRDVKEAA
jgi:hypothetical protein